MKIKLIDSTKTLDVVKELVYLLWTAVNGPSGMGFMQDRGDGVTKEEVWNQAFDSKDYATSRNTSGEVYMDYVFGRCMKTRIKYSLSDGIIELTPDKPEPTYQCWNRVYKTAGKAIAEATKNVLGVGILFELL